MESYRKALHSKVEGLISFFSLRKFVKTHVILTPGALLGWSLVAVRAPFPGDPGDPGMCPKIDF